MDMHMRKLSALIRSYREARDMTQAQLADALGNKLGENQPQNIVSYHERGERWGKKPWRLFAAYAEILDIPDHVILDLFDRHGTPVMSLDFADVVRRDPTLDDESKRHLVAQYGLLQAASAHRRHVDEPAPPARDLPTRAAIEAMDLPRRMKDILLADLAATEPESDDDEESDEAVETMPA